MGSVRSEAALLLGARVRDARQSLAISQEDLSELSEVHLASVGRIERGQANASLDTIVRLATALQLNPAVLVDGMSAEMLPGRRHTVTVKDLLRARRTG